MRSSWAIGHAGASERITDELSVSRSPVHHALTRLVGEGLITVESRRGYFVPPLTPNAVLDAYDVRLSLEIGAAEAIIGAITASFAELRRLLEPTVSAVEDGQLVDRRGYLHANRAFHECLIDLAGNPLLSDIYARLPVNLRMERILGAGDAAVGPVAEEHVRIVEAFERGDLAAATGALRDHVETGKRVAVHAIERAGRCDAPDGEPKIVLGTSWCTSAGGLVKFAMSQTPAVTPVTRCATSGDVPIAYQVVGEGSFDLDYVTGPMSHVDLIWENPARVPGISMRLRSGVG